MPARILHLGMLLFLALWFGVIAPGHTRGVIKMGSGSSCSAQVQTSGDAAGMSCCAMPSLADRDDETQDSEQAPLEDPASCCAICYLNSTLQTPEAISFAPGFVGLIAQLSPPPMFGQEAEPHFSPIHGRAPPACI